MYMEFIKCSDCERGPNGSIRDCKLGTKHDSVECVRGCFAGYKIGRTGRAVQTAEKLPEYMQDKLPAGKQDAKKRH